GKLTPAERLLRIQRYREKRQARNTHRNIKYQCRKSLAEARLRVKGRFVKRCNYIACIYSQSSAMWSTHDW
ncbi:CCT motif-domain-containing protein, partial [Haematococcus lacustris]